MTKVGVCVCGGGGLQWAIFCTFLGMQEMKKKYFSHDNARNFYGLVGKLFRDVFFVCLLYVQAEVLFPIFGPGPIF